MNERNKSIFMYLVVGLGNFGNKYDYTRHNVGFMALDYFAKKNNFEIDKMKFKSLISKQKINSKDVIFAKPQTYMNLSGEAVRDIKNFYNIPSENICVIYDDIDLDFNFIRIRKSGSGGTHNGMRNIVKNINTENFNRIRIGIGKNKDIDLADYVMMKFSKKELENLENTFSICENIIFDFLNNDMDLAMNKYNRK